MASGVLARAPSSVRASLKSGGRPHHLSKVQEKLVHYWIHYEKCLFSAAVERINERFTDQSTRQPLKVSLSTVKRLVHKLDKRAEHAEVVEVLDFGDNRIRTCEWSTEVRDVMVVKVFSSTFAFHRLLMILAGAAKTIDICMYMFPDAEVCGRLYGMRIRMKVYNVFLYAVDWRSASRQSCNCANCNRSKH